MTFKESEIRLEKTYLSRHKGFLPKQASRVQGYHKSIDAGAKKTRNSEIASTINIDVKGSNMRKSQEPKNFLYRSFNGTSIGTPVVNRFRKNANKSIQLRNKLIITQL